MAGQVGEMCITNKPRFSLFAIVPPDNPGLLFITAITYCRLQSRRVDFTLTLLLYTTTLPDARDTPPPSGRAHAPPPRSPCPLRPFSLPCAPPGTAPHSEPPHPPPLTAHRSQFCEKCRRPPAALILQSLHTRPKKRARTRKPSPEDDDLLSDSELVHLLQGWVTVSPPNFSRTHKC